jgi:hypothetical protein
MAAMSYSISISGHSSEPHNEIVKQGAEDLARKLQALPGSSGVTLSGYSNDGTGSVTLATPEPESAAPAE